MSIITSENEFSKESCFQIVNDFIKQRKPNAKPIPSSSSPSSSSSSSSSSVHDSGDADLLLIAQVCGSASYNLAIASSDVDYFGVFACDLRELFSVKGPRHSLDSHNPFDICCYELSYYCQLLLKGNPKLVEPIFLSNHLIYRHPLWDSLRDRGSSAVLTPTVLQQYIAFAFNQLSSAKQQTAAGRSAKSLYHALRLAYEAARISAGQPPAVFLEGPQRDAIIALRLGHTDPAASEAEARAILASLDGQPVQAALSDEDAARRFVDDWAYQVRLHQASARAPEKTQNLRCASALLPSLLSPEELEGLREDIRRCHPEKELCDILAVCRSGSALHQLLRHQAWPSRGEPTQDRVVVYLESARSHLRDRSAPANASSFTTARGDLLVEAGYFASLLAAGNHRAVECLEQEAPLFATAAWDVLRASLPSFYTRAGIAHLLGLASKLINSPPADADCRHQNMLLALRLLSQAQSQLDSRGLLDLSITSLLLESVHLPPDSLSALVRSAMSDSQSKSRQSTLPKTCDISILDSWLYSLRIETFI